MRNTGDLFYYQLEFPKKIFVKFMGIISPIIFYADIFTKNS